MDNSLTLKKTQIFALKLYQLLRDMDPARWKDRRKLALKDKIHELEAEVHSLFDSLQEHNHETLLPSAMSAKLKIVGELLSELKNQDIDHHLSYLALYTLRKRMQRAYQDLALIMEAHQTPIPELRPTNYMRTLFHVLNAIFILVLIETTTSLFLFQIATAYVLFCWTMETLKRIHPSMKARVMKIFEKIAHPHEYDKINSATWYGHGLLFLSLMHSATLGSIAVAILGFADPAAALVGRKYGKTKLPGNRTLEGSLAFVLVGTLSASVMMGFFHPVGNLWQTLFVAFSAAFCGAIGELIGKYPDDNLTIPMAAAGGAFLALSLI